jgi:hypothetical protein
VIAGIGFAYTIIENMRGMRLQEFLTPVSVGLFERGRARKFFFRELG